MQKKLQVFISSTRDDLTEERQIALMTVLEAEHIPVVMEFFAVGDTPPLNIIRKWIKASDVFMLLLGDKYCHEDFYSLEEKSYTELTYDIAMEEDKPIVLIYISEKGLQIKVTKDGFGVVERKHREEYNKFKEKLELNVDKIKKEWQEPKDIKPLVYQSLYKLKEEYEDLNGWIRSDQLGEKEDEINDFKKEYARLQERFDYFVDNQKDITVVQDDFDCAGFLKTCEAIRKKEIFGDGLRSILSETVKKFGDETPNYFHYLWYKKDKLFDELEVQFDAEDSEEQLSILDFLHRFDIVEEVKDDLNSAYTSFSSSGKKFYMRMLVNFRDI